MSPNTVDNHQPVLVTGCPRSGTTWVGATIGASPEVYYFYEPFNNGAPHHLDFRHRYIFLTEENASTDYPKLEALIKIGHFKGRCKNLFLGWPSWWQLVEETVNRVIQDKTIDKKNLSSAKQYSCNPNLWAKKVILKHPSSFFSAKRVLLKDPLAFFSAPWLAQAFKMKVIVLIRHPAGVISSHLKLNWDFDFSPLLDQPLLKQKYLESFEGEIQKVRQEHQTSLAIATLQWKLFGYITALYQKQYPDWLFVRHEDLCKRPILEFKRIFSYLGMQWTPAIEQKIVSDTGDRNITDLPSPTQHALQRNTQRLHQVWKQRLSASEIAYIKQQLQPVAEQFYAAEDW